MNSRTALRKLTWIAVITAVAAGIGFVVTISLNAFVLNSYDEYGHVPIPGTGTVQLPAGDVAVTFHTVLVGGGGSSLPVPPLNYRITGPGEFDGVLDENYGATTIVNNDARVRIGYLHLPAAGSYDVTLDGKVGAYLEPELAFGKDSSLANLPPILAAVFGVALVVLFVVRIWARRVKRRDLPPPPAPSVNWTPTSVSTEYPQPAAAFTASEEGIRAQTLETLARLRDSGALTEDEYEAEKKRVLEGR